MEAVYLIAITVLATAGIILYLRYPSLKKYLPFFSWLAKTIRITVDHWSSRKIYKDSAEIIERYTILLDMYSFNQSSATSRQWFVKFISDTYDKVLADTGSKEDAARISNAFYSLILNHNDIIDALKALDDFKDIDVKRTTLIFIDFLGEFFTLSIKMERQFYEMMIVGINKALLQMKAGGLNKKTLNQVSATVWRMFQLARAYKDAKDRQGLTKSEFEKKMQEALSTLLSYLK